MEPADAGGYNIHGSSRAVRHASWRLYPCWVLLSSYVCAAAAFHPLELVFVLVHACTVWRSQDGKRKPLLRLLLQRSTT